MAGNLADGRSTAQAAKKGPLRQLHRLLMVLAITLGAVFTIFSIDRYLERGSSSSAGIAVITALATLALAFYLRWFSRKT